MSGPEKALTRRELSEDLKKLKEEVVHEFHVISEWLMDHIKLLAEGHIGVVQQLDRMEKGFAEMRAENERHHIETRALV